jgi:ABC-type branched-subunit amino acid transport system substrate-binding protein
MKTNKGIWWAIGIVVIVFVVVVSLVQRHSASAPTVASNGVGAPIKIGVILPETGDLSVTGEKIYNGVLLAAAQLPSNVQLIYEDDHSNVTDGVTAATKLLDVDKVDMIIGTYDPDETIAIAPLAKAQGKYVFSFSYCDDRFATLDNVFCGYPSAAKQLATAIPLIQKQNIKKIAMVDSNSGFGIDSKNAMNAMASQLGYSVVLDDFLPTSATRDYQTEALKVMKSGADAVFTATDDPADALTLVKDLHALGFKGTRITFVDTDDKYLAQFGAAAEGTFAPGIAPSDFSQAFTTGYQAKYNSAPDYTAALGYDFIRDINGALVANNWSLTNIATSVIVYQYPDPAINSFQFLPDRTVNYAMELWEAQNGHYAKAPGY